MKQTITGMILLLMLFGSAGCIDKRHTLRGEGSVISDQRYTSSFSEVEIDGDVEGACYYAPSGQERVVVNGYQNLVAAFETNVNGGRLKLKFKDKYWSIRNNNLKVDVYTSALRRINLNGSGNVDVAESPGSKDLEATIDGSGRINIHNGTFDGLTLQVNGSGEISSRDAAAQNVSAAVSGSGYIATRVFGHFFGRVSGSGAIDYWGHPISADTRVDGSGSINRK